MNLFSIIGLALGAVVFVIGLRLSSDNLLIFLDPSSFFIVMGGTFAATAISFRLDKISMLFKIFLSHILGSNNFEMKKTIAELISLSDQYRKGDTLESLGKKTNDYFLKEALELANDGILTSEQLLLLLEDRAENMNFKRLEDATKVKTIGKFPPAFGMMGTTIGMIVLLANLGGADAIKKIGPAMGVCLITTLYGVAVANLIIIPISENLIESAKETHIKNLIVIQGIKHILEKSAPVTIAEDLNSFLLPSERLDWKKVL